MSERPEYTWDDLVGDATRVTIWHPNAIPNPFGVPGLHPENVPPYGDRMPELKGDRRRTAVREREENLGRLSAVIFLGEAALWQTYSASNPKKRSYSNIILMGLAMQERHSVHILPFSAPLPKGAQTPFTIYRRRGEQTPIVTREIDGRLFHSDHPNLIDEKQKLLAEIAFHAVGEEETQEIIRQAVAKQCAEL